MHVLVCLDIVLTLMQDRCTIYAERSIGLENHFGCTRRISYVTLVMWNLVSIHLVTVAVLMQVTCTVCAKRTIGTEIILDAPDGTSR
jgi:hypothetical protein